MSDVLYTSRGGRAGALAKALEQIPGGGADQVRTFSGGWGSLAATASRYGGFAPVETAREVIAVVGAPVLTFGSNSHLSHPGSDGGTRAILERFHRGTIDWSADLSGPFAIILIDKIRGRVVLITDLMSFVPVYHLRQDGAWGVGTHPDALAESSPGTIAVDEASLVDLVLHGVITYPYTNYVNMWQLPPATLATLDPADDRKRFGLAAEPYWLPTETRRYDSITEAAADLDEALRWYASTVTNAMDQVAYLASGGEDSRVVAATIPPTIDSHAFVATDTFNREARLAQRVAQRLGAEFHHMPRPQHFYLDGMGAMGRLSGYHAQSTHAHFLGLSTRFGLAEFPAVFGGYFADSILKASAARKSAASSSFRFLPERLTGGQTRTAPVHSRHFSPGHVREVTNRRIAHFERISTLRPDSAHEWFALWPASMRKGLPNITTGRRLMASFEPFTSAGIVKLGAGTPAAWKVNRRLFRLGTARYLQATRGIPHGDGRRPYYPWWVNGFLQLPTWAVLAAKRIGAAAGLPRTYEGPWADWYALARSGALARAAAPFQDGLRRLPLRDDSADIVALMHDDTLAIDQRSTLLNLSIWLSDTDSLDPRRGAG